MAKKSESPATCYALSLKKKKGYETSDDAFEAMVEGGPVCQGCGAPMSAFAVYHAHPDRLPLKNHAAIGVFICAREPGDDWDDWWERCSPGNPPSVDGRRAVLYATKPTLKKKGKPGHYALVPDRDEDQDEPAPVGFRERSGCKLGGAPRTIGGGDPGEPPECKACKKVMKFVAQIGTTEGLKYDSGDGFVGHVYVCPAEHEATLEVIFA